MNSTSVKTTIRKVRNIAAYAPHRVYASLLIGGAIIVPSLAIFAYGPDRPTYTIENPSDHITFNSITNNPNHGDERNFVWIKEAGTSQWQDSEMNVQPGKTYTVRMYVHNNAAANLNLVAQNTRLSANVPTTTGTQAQIDGFITADNASPQKVWDDVVLKSDQRFNIAYVPGSTKYYNNVNPSTGFNLPDSIVTNSGALIGYEQMDGNVPGCFQYSGIATFNIKIQGEQTANFEVTKQVRKHAEGQTGNWSKSVTANPGEKVDYLISYKNTGETTQNNVVAKDSLPTGLTYNNSTTKLFNASNPAPNGLTTSDNLVQPSGINIGNYASQNTALVTFTSTVAAEKDLPQCGNNLLRNTAYIETDYGSKSDYADVTVKKNCADTASYSCDALQATKITTLQYNFDVKLSSKLAKAKEITVDFGDGQTAIRDANSLPVSHTYAQAGQYTVTAKASFEVDGKTVTDVTSDACKVVINTDTTPVTTTGTTTPTSLPSTGPVEIFSGILGFSALGLGIQQWIASRRAVSEALRHQ